ncbi:MAG: hypothetical protein ABI780_11890 [Ardenticatenales bacterium]
MHASMTTRTIAAVAVALFATTLVACGPSTVATPAASLDAAVAGDVNTAGDAGDAGRAPIDVQVTVGEYAISPTLTTFQTGVPYRFLITNKGLLAHEFRIMPRGDTAAMIAMVGANGGMTGTHTHPGELVSIAAEQLPPGGQTEVKAVFLTPGDFEIGCHVAGHAEAGMVIPITIAGDTFAGAPTADQHSDGQVIVDTNQMADMPCHRMSTTIMGQCNGADIERLMAEMHANGMLHMHDEGGMPMSPGTMPMSGTMPFSGTMPMSPGAMPMSPGAMPMSPGAHGDDHGGMMGGTASPTTQP